MKIIVNDNRIPWLKAVVIIAGTEFFLFAPFIVSDLFGHKSANILVLGEFVLGAVAFMIWIAKKVD